MTKEYLTGLVSLAVGSLALLGVILTHFGNKAREERAFKRQQRQGKVDNVRTAYEDAVTVIERVMRSDGSAEKEDIEALSRANAKLSLVGSLRVRNQFDQTTHRLQEWITAKQQSEPAVHGNFMIIKAGIDYVGRAREAEKLSCMAEEELYKLVEDMREHIMQLEEAI